MSSKTATRKLYAWEFLSLDGIMESPEKWVNFESDAEVTEFVKNENLAADALLLGRLTYEALITFWPSQTHNEFGFAEKLNRMPKYVVSSSLREASWNNTTVLRGDALEQVANLKQQPGGAIGMTGSASLIHALTQHGLIDEFHLLVHPLALGKGLRLFEPDHPVRLELREARPFRSGVVLLSYAPARD